MKKIAIVFTLLLLIAPLSQAALQLDDDYEGLNHQRISLKSAVGHQPVYLKFWASWCLDCRRELPSLEQAYHKYHDRIAMFAVNLNINETGETIHTLLQKNPLTIPVVFDNNGSIARNFNFAGTPFHVLINGRGEVVYTTYKDDAVLAQKLDQLAKESTLTRAETHTEKPSDITGDQLPKGVALVYFSATWCDWYMKDIQPEMTHTCINAINLVDKIYHRQPKPQLQAYVTYLWSSEKDLQEYRQRFNIPYAVTIDQNNKQFQRYHASQYPTLLLFKDGKEIDRIIDFDDSEKIIAQINKLLKNS